MCQVVVGPTWLAEVLGLERHRPRPADRRRPAGPLRVMYVQPAEVLGGAERQGVLHIGGLRQFGVDVVPVVGPTPLIRSALEQRGIFDYVYLDEFFCEQDRPLPVARRLAFELERARLWFRLQSVLADIAVARRVDAIVANRSVGWIVASPVARRLGIPMVWRGGGRPTSAMQRSVLRLYAHAWPPDLVLANCEAVRTELAALVPCPSQVLPNGVDTRRFDPARVVPRFRRELELDPETPVIGLAARPAPEKNLELLGRGLLRVARRFPAVRLLIAGEFGWRAHYQQLYVRMGLAERTTFLGHVEDIESFFASCDVVALTSRAQSIEGAPNAVLEAMAMARPVVATAIGGVPELLLDGVQGFLVPPGDADALAGHIVQLLADARLRARMGARGRATIEQRFDEVAVIQQLVSVLQEIAGREASRRVPPAAARVGLG